MKQLELFFKKHWVIVLLVLVFLGHQAYKSKASDQPETHRPMNELSGLNASQISRVEIIILSDNARRFTVYPRHGRARAYEVPTESAETIRQRIEAAHIPIKKMDNELFTNLLIELIKNSPFFIFCYFVYRSIKGNSQVKTQQAPTNTNDRPNVTFADIGGYEEVKEELVEVVQHLRNPGDLKALGGKLPRGVLLSGPPGTGKTHLARAVAGEAGVPFFAVAGSQFSNKYVGEGAARVRNFFAQALAKAPCIVFIDEIDSIGGDRDEAHAESAATLNQLLVELDGFTGTENMVIMAATNRLDALDPALRRAGRFDRIIVVSSPDAATRQKILEATIRSRKVPVAAEVNLRAVAQGTPGYSGADLSNLVNEAALSANRAKRKFLNASDFDVARDRLIMGLQSTRVIGETERRVIAIHEAGHAIIALHLEDSDPIHKVTIISRGDALGMVVRLPDEDHYMATRKKLIADMAVALGGRLAEELEGDPDNVTSGASNDLARVREIATAMVNEYGFSSSKKPVYLIGLDSDESTREYAQQTHEDVKGLVEEAKNKALEILKGHAGEHKKLVAALLERETLTLEEIEELLELDTDEEKAVREDPVTTTP